MVRRNPPRWGDCGDAGDGLVILRVGLDGWLGDGLEVLKADR